VGFTYGMLVDGADEDYGSFPMDMNIDNDYVTLSMDPLLKQNGMVYNVTLTASNAYLYYGVKIY
jgi:hypothetical protein